MTFGVLALVYIALLLTPKVGKLIDDYIKKYRQKHPKPEEDERLYMVKSAFDGNREIDIDKLYEQEKARRELSAEQQASNKNEQDTNINNTGDVKDNG